MRALNFLPCPVLVTDLHGHVLKANRELLRLMGWVNLEQVGREMEDMLPPPGRIFLQTHIWPTLLQKGEMLEVFLQLINAQQQRVPVMVNCRRIQEQGHERIYWVFFVALERSRFESELLQARSDAQRLASELAQARARLESNLQQLSQHTQAVEVQNLSLTALSQTDPLTGLGNRRALDMAVQQWQTSNDTQASASLLMVDVDFFKRINDTLGHDEGDKVLQGLAQRLKASIRLSDLAVRFGGEEFVIWLPNADRQGASYTAERIHEHMTSLFVGQNAVTVSIGVMTARNTQPSHFSESLLQAADQALYKAKTQGRNQTMHAQENAAILLPHPQRETTPTADKNGAS